jgi:hypothetical protein
MDAISERAGAATPAPGGEEAQGSRWVPQMHQISGAAVELAHEWRFIPSVKAMS